MAHPSADQSSVGPRGLDGEGLPARGRRGALGVGPGIVELDGLLVAGLHADAFPDELRGRQHQTDGPSVYSSAAA